MENILFGSLICIAFIILFNFLRPKEKINFPLRTNCLLTRSPILFVHGKKSILYFRNYWNLIPIFLIQHGYECSELRLDWKTDETRNKQLLKFLKNSTKTYHIFFDPSSIDQLKFIAKLNIPQIESLHLFCNKECELDIFENEQFKIYPNTHLLPQKRSIINIVLKPFHKYLSHAKSVNLNVLNPNWFLISDNKIYNYYLNVACDIAEKDYVFGE